MADYMIALEGGQRIRGTLSPKVSDRPLVSIVTVVFNAADTLESTIRSVLSQDYPSVEYIVVDGGSTDGTIDILRSYDERIAYWVSGPDRGIYDAMNRGISLASGDWVGLINADDRYAPGAVKTAMQHAANRSEVNIVHGDIWVHYGNGARKLKRPKLSGFLLRYWEMVLNHPTFFVRRTYYTSSHMFDIRLTVAADQQWTLRAWSEDPGQFLYVRAALAHFAAGGVSTSTSLAQALAEGLALGRSVGMNRAQLLIGHAVRVALYIPQRLKIRQNQRMRPGV